MMRTVLLAFMCLEASTSHAEDMLPGGATLKFNKLLLHEHNSPDLLEPEVDPDSKYNYFNLAHCVCSLEAYNEPIADFYEDKFAWEIMVENFTTAVDHPVEIWTGSNCNTQDTTQRNADCHHVTDGPTVTTINTNSGARVEIPLYDLMIPKLAERPGCQPHQQDAATWALVDGDGDGTQEYGVSEVVHVDTQPPPLPDNFRAVGAENAVVISWDPPADISDIAYYQALCEFTVDPNTGAGGTPGTSSPKAPRYLTPQALCGSAQTLTLLAKEITSNAPTDAGVGSITLSSDIAALNPNYVCGETTSSTATSMRIEGLNNNSNYTVVFLAIDLYGNATGAYFTSSLVPRPATDFWEDLQDQGSGVEGGFCLIAQTYGDGGPLTDTLRAFRDDTLATTAFGRWLIDVYYGTIGSLNLHGSLALRVVAALLLAPLVVFALLWHLLTLPGLVALLALALLLRKRPRWIPRFAIVATLLIATRARAQAPYWEQPITTNENRELSIGDPDRVSWHAGVRLGPYVPEIDAQLNMPSGKYAGPYEQMFGGWTIVPMLDVERFFLRRPGQLGVGISLGYLGKKARAWVSGSDPQDPDRPRAEGDENSFRLFPLSLNAVYRLTWFDDEYGVPLVPYARLGFAYYIWWISAPSGGFAKACIDGSMTDGCATTTAAGASMGVVGSVGLAIRAERIDEAAARSMRESGIEHAGFYGELSVGKVDGFGSSKRLSVGDTTWFAGVDFEF